MIRTVSLILAAACCLPAQTGGGGYFQGMVKEARTRIREVSVDQLAALQKAAPAPVLVDVREDNEWEKSRIPGAIHVGRGVIESSIESRVPEKSAPVVVYCQSGRRSALVADVLAKMGYANVTSLAGGLTAYAAAGLPVDQSPAAK